MVDSTQGVPLCCYFKAFRKKPGPSPRGAGFHRRVGRITGFEAKVVQRLIKLIRSKFFRSTFRDETLIDSFGSGNDINIVYRLNLRTNGNGFSVLGAGNVQSQSLLSRAGLESHCEPIEWSQIP